MLNYFSFFGLNKTGSFMIATVNSGIIPWEMSSLRSAIANSLTWGTFLMIIGLAVVFFASSERLTVRVILASFFLVGYGIYRTFFTQLYLWSFDITFPMISIIMIVLGSALASYAIGRHERTWVGILMFMRRRTTKAIIMIVGAFPLLYGLSVFSAGSVSFDWIGSLYFSGNKRPPVTIPALETMETMGPLWVRSGETKVIEWGASGAVVVELFSRVSSYNWTEKLYTNFDTIVESKTSAQGRIEIAESKTIEVTVKQYLTKFRNTGSESITINSAREGRYY